MPSFSLRRCVSGGKSKKFDPVQDSDCSSPDLDPGKGKRQSAGSSSKKKKRGSITKTKIQRSISQGSAASTGSRLSLDSLGGSSHHKRSSTFRKTKGFNEDVSHFLQLSISDSPILSAPAGSHVEFYDPEDVGRGSKFQAGEFFDLVKIKYLPNKEEEEDDDDDDDDDDNDSFSGEIMEIPGGSGHQSLNSTDDDGSSLGSNSNHHQKQNNKLYVLKQINHRHSKEKQIIEQATLRLVLEAKFLSRLNHPNILRVKGVTVGEEQPLLNGGANPFFIVTERCTETLEGRLARWRQEPPPPAEVAGDSSFFNLCTPINQRKMKYAVDLVEALNYLHNQNIVVLNLRPETIGFLPDGTIQIRDLSCCKEIRKGGDDDDSEFKKWDDYNDDDGPLGFNCNLKVKKGGGGGGGAGHDAFSQMTAAKSNFLVLEASVDGLPRPRYVAPEAILESIYTPAADTYSWAHILFELLTLSKPYALYKLGQLLTKVCLDGSRPNLSVYRFPQPLESLLQLSWQQSFSHRPSTKALLEAIPLLMQLSSSSSGKETTVEDDTTPQG